MNLLKYNRRRTPQGTSFSKNPPSNERGIFFAPTASERAPFLYSKERKENDRKTTTTGND